jgi:iron(III) transport system substrate-binding protein
VGTAPAATELTVYTAYENDDLNAYKKAFEAENPDIIIKWVRDSTGVIAARLLAEKDNTRADAVWGLAVTNVDLLKKNGLLQAYSPKGFAAIAPQFRDSANPPYWFGNSGWIGAITYNEIEGKKRGIPAPKAWTDLADPIYKDQIVMPNPASSGTGFIFVNAWLQSMGEEEAWKFMDKLNQNIAFYTHSGSSPAVMAARGERVVGLAIELRGARLKQEGAPVQLIFPAVALGWEMNAFAIMKGTPKLKEAQRLADWASSENAMRIYGATRAVVAEPAMAAKIPFIPDDISQRLMKQDFAWASTNMQRILDEWEKRYGSKSEPKKK